MAILSVEDLSKRIGNRELVRNLTFQIEEGEIFGFLGPNGAGKTTTIRMLVGLIRPTRGKIVINGYDLRKEFLPAIRQVGCIVENPELYPYLTGRENLELFARMVEDIEEDRILEVVRIVELEQRIDEPVKTYSLGMKQRLGIAQALLGQPKLLILDEPTNGLDPAGIRELRTFIQDLAHRQGISILISSHILHEIQLMCDKVAIIYNGEIVHTGGVEEILESNMKIEWTLSPIDKGISLLTSLDYVKKVETLNESRILVYMPVEKIAETNRALVQENIMVTGIHPLKKTLEDIFLEMTGGDSLAQSNL